MQKILFVCSENVRRSKTAEVIFSRTYETRSAGLFCKNTDKTTQMNGDLWNWADIVFVFEEIHVKELESIYPDSFANKLVVNLEILDMYRYMADNLVYSLKHKVPRCRPYLRKKRLKGAVVRWKMIGHV
ncbi:MAG: protein tyrosine phosphatase [archaeon]